MTRCTWPGHRACPNPVTVAVTVTFAQAPGQPYYARLCARHLSSQTSILRPGDVITAERLPDGAL